MGQPVERLSKILARAGIASRRAAEGLIEAGRVRVDGRVVTELGTRHDPGRERIEVDGRRIIAEVLVYLVLHKPRNVVSTMSDPEGRPTVADLVRGVPARLFPVGRLDFATSGVLLMTNDGAFSNGLLHPKEQVPKTYVVKAQGELSERDLAQWSKGIELEDGLTAPAKTRLLRYEGDKTWFEVTLFEGRNQQIRRMGDATGHRVMRLARVSFAGITHDGLRPGAWRALTVDELTKLRERYGVPKRVRAAAKHAPAPPAALASSRPGRSRTDKPRTDKPRTDKPRADKPRADKPRADKPRTDKPRTDKPRADKPRADKPTARGAARPGGARPGRPRSARSGRT